MFRSCEIHHQGVRSCAWLKLLLVIHRYFVVCLVGVWRCNSEPMVCMYGPAMHGVSLLVSLSTAAVRLCTGWCKLCDKAPMLRDTMTVKKAKQSLDRPWGLQEVETPRFHHTRHRRVVKLLALCTDHFYPQEIFLVVISVRGWVEPLAIVQLEGLRQWKIPVTLSGIEPVTFQLVARCRNDTMIVISWNHWGRRR
jgi:hypothetical protein